MLRALAVVLVLIGCASCGGAGENGTDTPAIVATALPSPTPRAAALAGDPGFAVRGAIEACREKSGDRLRSLVAADVTDAELRTLFDRGRDVQLVSQTVPEIAADTATVVVGLRILRDGGTDVVERTWELVQGDDDVWRFAELPDCF